MGIWPAPYPSLMPAQVVFEEQSKLHFDSKVRSDALWLMFQILGSGLTIEIFPNNSWVCHDSINAAIISVYTENTKTAMAS